MLSQHNLQLHLFSIVLYLNLLMCIDINFNISGCIHLINVLYYHHLIVMIVFISVE